MTEIEDELLESDVFESATKAQKIFRLRFRVPYSMFRDIVAECKEAKIFDNNKSSNSSCKSSSWGCS
jgi:hypothetical protein